MVMNEPRNWIAQLYQENHAEIGRYLVRLLRSTSTAEDLLQETFIRVQRLGFSRTRNPRSLLYAVATNLALTHIRCAQKEPLNLSEGLTSDTPDGNASPCDIAQLDEALLSLDRALQKLPRRLREVWAMRWVEGSSREEIAQRLNLTAAAVDQRLTRAMAVLKRKLTQAGFGGLYLE